MQESATISRADFGESPVSDAYKVDISRGERIGRVSSEWFKPLPDRLLTELTTHRTLALRLELGYRFDVAFLAVLHALCLRVFYHYALDTCLDLDVKSVTFGAQAPGLNDTMQARTLAQRHQDWLAKMPKQPEDLWASLTAMGELHREALFAHCVGLSVNGVYEAYSRRPKALAHADMLARAVDLDMAAAGWVPTVDNYLGRVTKARIVQAVVVDPDALRPVQALEGRFDLAGAAWAIHPAHAVAQRGSTRRGCGNGIHGGPLWVGGRLTT